MQVQKGSIKEITLLSDNLGGEVTVLLYYPPSFSPLYKYHVLIAQDGRDYFQLGRLGRLADKLLQEKKIENVIIAGVPYQSVEDRRRKYHPDGEMHQSYIRFLAHELVPYMDKELPTYNMGMGRALIGDSLGATVSLMAAMQYPNVFGKVLLQSPYVNEEVLHTVGQFSQPHLLEIYHVIGNKETEVKTGAGKRKDFLTPNRDLAALFKEKGFSYFYEEFDGDHTWTYWQPDLRRALTWAFKRT